MTNLLGWATDAFNLILERLDRIIVLLEEQAERERD